jgi:hypothetical protein
MIKSYLSFSPGPVVAELSLLIRLSRRISPDPLITLCSDDGGLKGAERTRKVF